MEVPGWDFLCHGRLFKIWTVWWKLTAGRMMDVGFRFSCKRVLSRIHFPVSGKWCRGEKGRIYYSIGWMGKAVNNGVMAYTTFLMNCRHKMNWRFLWRFSAGRKWILSRFSCSHVQKCKVSTWKSEGKYSGGWNASPCSVKKAASGKLVPKRKSLPHGKIRMNSGKPLKNSI